MKKIVSLLLFAWSFFLTSAQEAEEWVILKKTNLKPIETITDEQGREIDKETQALCRR